MARNLAEIVPVPPAVAAASVVVPSMVLRPVLMLVPSGFVTANVGCDGIEELLTCGSSVGT